METWKRNLVILWFGTFFSSVGIGMIIPFLPLYVQELGVHDLNQAALWSAFIFGINHLMIALVSPFWGKFSDKYGQKITMVRSGIGLSIIIAAMGLVDTPLQLLLLRAVFGMMGGFATCAVALIAIETPKANVGKALGTLQTGQVTGNLFGPLLGGLMAEWLGMRNSFFFTGLFIFIATLLVLIAVKETKPYARFTLNWRLFQKPFRKTGEKQPQPSSKPGFGHIVKNTPVIVTLFISTFLLAASFQSISPVITLYVSMMNIEDHVEIMAGLIFASTALGTMIAAPILGRIGDRFGHLNVLLCCLFVTSVLYIPQARITDPWALMGVRFLTGLCAGGLVPSISALLRRLTPAGIQGSVFAYNTSANSLGNVSGALFGGLVAGQFGIPALFYIIASVFFIHGLMLVFQYKSIGRARDRQDADDQ